MEVDIGVLVDGAVHALVGELRAGLSTLHVDDASWGGLELQLATVLRGALLVYLAGLQHGSTAADPCNAR